MKRQGIKLGLLALLLAVGTASLAQEPVRKLEFEIGLGPSTVMAKGERYGSISLFTELRGNLQHSHWDVGMQIGTGGQFTTADYDVEIGGGEGKKSPVSLAAAQACTSAAVTPRPTWA